MSEDSQLEELINMTLEGTLTAIPNYIQDIEQNKTIMKVDNVKEFVFGVIIGMSLGMATTALASIRDGEPSIEDQIKIRDMVYAKIPQIRERIYS